MYESIYKKVNKYGTLTGYCEIICASAVASDLDNFSCMTDTFNHTCN